jgi:hypothetical protein
MNQLSEDQWDELRSKFIHENLPENLRIRFAELFLDNEELIPFISFADLTVGQQEAAFQIYLDSINAPPAGGRRSKKNKRTRRRRGSRKSRARKTRRHR